MTIEWRAFRIQEGNLRYRLNAVHECSLMGLECPACSDVWAATGISYPSIGCSVVSSVQPPVSRHLLDVADDPKIMGIDDYDRLCKELAPTLGDRRPLRPGVEFGRLQGEGRGRFGDFLWPDSWTPLVRESVFESMLGAGFELVGVPADLKLFGGEQEKYVEIEAPPLTRLSPSCGVRICELCGHPDTRGARRIIDGETFDASIPVQRILEFATNVVVSASFAQFIRQRNLSDVTLSPLNVA